MVTQAETMRAVWVERFGPVDALSVADVPRPVPGPGEVLIQVEAAGVNPSDVKNVEGQMHRTTLPRIPGRDFAGTVVAGEPELAGAAVWGVGGEIGFTRQGSHAEYLALPASGVRRRPSTLDAAQSAAVGVAFVTAWHGLVDAAALEPSETVLAIGSSGAVGMAVVQIARWAGARVVGVDRRPVAVTVPEQMRPHAYVDASVPDLAAAVREVAGRGADVAFNTVAGAAFSAHLSALARRGRMVAISSVGERHVTFDLVDFYHQELRLIGVDSLALDAGECADILDRLAEGFRTGALAPPLVGREYTLEAARTAYIDVAHGTTVGKVVLRVASRPPPEFGARATKSGDMSTGNAARRPTPSAPAGCAHTGPEPDSLPSAFYLVGRGAVACS
jgi:NADPH:quinone reductase